MPKKNSFYSEKELIALLKINDKRAFEYVYDHYGPAFYNIVCKITRDQIKAHDVMQDSFIKIWQNIALYDTSKGTLFTWMLNVVRNTAIDRTRVDCKFQSNIKWNVVTDSDLETTAIFNPEQSTLDLKTVLEKLIPERKEVVEMVYLEGYTHQETSERLCLPLGTVKSRIRAALQELRYIFDVPMTSMQIG
ncbi:RNA polymerase sigma factor [Dyadobacter sp. 3J3]|uniref:RNA polymerase sigma factor n=1 Tax=Dyadobacter sp. 3J3 TaxID=2606600 RepID=UPI0013583142|nr:RNA polymerase sigma factor [Dyadobacter sp. 3J3]